MPEDEARRWGMEVGVGSTPAAPDDSADSPADQDDLPDMDDLLSSSNAAQSAPPSLDDAVLDAAAHDDTPLAVPLDAEIPVSSRAPRPPATAAPGHNKVDDLPAAHARSTAETPANAFDAGEADRDTADNALPPETLISIADPPPVSPRPEGEESSGLPTTEVTASPDLDSAQLHDLLTQGPPEIPDEDDPATAAHADDGSERADLALPATEAHEPELSPELVDALIAAAGVEPLPAPAPSAQAAAAVGVSPPTTDEDEPAVPGEIPEQLVPEEPEEIPTVIPVAPSAAAATPNVPPSHESPPPSVKSRRRWRSTAALIAGVFAGVGTFATLYHNQLYVPPLSALKTMKGLTLAEAMAEAEILIRAGDPRSAADLLESTMAGAAEGAELASARYLHLEALRQSMPLDSSPPDYTKLHGTIDSALAASPRHERAPSALLWKAELYETQGMPLVALETYDRILKEYGDSTVVDDALLAATRDALGIGKIVEAADYARTFLQQFAGSPRVSEAHLLLGDIYALSGMYDDARTLYIRTAESAPFSPSAAEALLRLGRLAYQLGDFADTVRQLETRLVTTTTTEGNDEVYLLLSRAYRNLGQLQASEDALQDLLTYFPDSPLLPDAHIELSRVLDARGERQRALRAARQAAALFPLNAAVLRNLGEFAGLNGETIEAAKAFVAADNAGAENPELLLTAARHYASAGWNDEALAAYKDLSLKYGDSYAALSGMVEEAEILYGQGKTGEAVDQLERLAKSARLSPRRLPVLLSLSRIYADLGLAGRVVELASEIAQATTDPNNLAQAAIALVSAKRVDDAAKLVERIEISQLDEHTAYALLSSLGSGRLADDPAEALKLLETAYMQYPQARRPEGDRALLDAYIRLDRPAAAKRMVLDLENAVRAQPIDAPLLIDAAIAWGDYLYNKGDYRAAVDAYAMAVQYSKAESGTIEGVTQSVDWATFQQGNSLVASGDLQAGIPLLEEIAASDAPWAEEAATRAAYARADGLRKGVELPPSTPVD